jgi:hypothetical protein
MRDEKIKPQPSAKSIHHRGHRGKISSFGPFGGNQDVVSFFCRCLNVKIDGEIRNARYECLDREDGIKENSR